MAKKAEMSGKIKLPDTIIAGTAIVDQINLATANIDDFKNIEKLKIVKT